MDVDPLSDTVPPRYNIESDDEEDEVRPLSVAPAPVNFDVRIAGDTPQGKGLLVVTGDFARLWAKGADLGEQSAAVYVNNVQIGLVFQPTWTQSTVIVSEALSRLPLSAMHPYAKSILGAFKPKSLSLLDSYPVPTYVTDAPIPFHEAPLRYLSTAEDTAFLNTGARPFAPPNLIQSTSAAFLALASLPTPTPIPATLLLLPAPHIPPPAPRDIAPSNIAQLNQDDSDADWPAALIDEAQRLAFEALGEKIAHAWKLRDGVEKARVAKRTTEIGEGGMYI